MQGAPGPQGMDRGDLQGPSEQPAGCAAAPPDGHTAAVLQRRELTGAFSALHGLADLSCSFFLPLDPSGSSSSPLPAFCFLSVQNIGVPSVGCRAGLRAQSPGPSLPDRRGIGSGTAASPGMLGARAHSAPLVTQSRCNPSTSVPCVLVCASSTGFCGRFSSLLNTAC